jgi:membrane-bound lytic murein transglycosylase D
LKSKNRIRKDADLRPGMVLNLQEPRKRGEEIPVLVPLTATSAAPTLGQPAAAPSAVEEVIAKPKEQTPSFHTVNAGETLFSISRKYGITIAQLKELNGIGEQNLITVGQKLRIIVR